MPCLSANPDFGVLAIGVNFVGERIELGQGMKQGMKAVMLGIGVAVLAACSHPTTPETTSPPVTAFGAALSGTYVAAGQDAKSHYFIEALRLTPSGSGQFSGSLESTTLDPTGKIQSASQNVTGSTDGHQVTVTIDQFMGHTNRTGSITADGITLSWLDKGQLDHEAFNRKTDAEYGQMLDAMKQGSTSLTAQEQQRQAQAEAGKQALALTDRINRFLQKVPTWSLAAQQARHDHAMQVAQADLARTKQLMTGGDVSRSQAQVTVDQMQVAHIQLGVAIDSDKRELSEAKEKLTALDADVQQTPCLAPDGTLALHAVPECGALPEAVRSYNEARPKADAFLAQVAALDAKTDADFVGVLHEAEEAAGMPQSH